MDNNIILLGGNILNSGVVDYCKIQGYNVVVVDWSPNAYLKGDLFLCVDVKDYATIIKELTKQNITDVKGVFSSIDLAVPSVVALCEHFGLKHTEESTIENVTSKSMMTAIWKENGLLNRYSSLYTELRQEVIELNKKCKIIIKPNVSSSSRGITVVPLQSELAILKTAFAKAQNESFDSKVIIEEFVEGREFTVDMLGDAEGNVSVYGISVKYHTQNTDNNKIAVKLHYNSDVYEDATYQRIADYGRACYKALGLRSSLGHLEVLMKEDGTISPVEIGARSSGFIANPLVSLASGHDYIGDYFSVQRGNSISPVDYINGEQSSMYYFYDISNS